MKKRQRLERPRLRRRESGGPWGTGELFAYMHALEDYCNELERENQRLQGRSTEAPPKARTTPPVATQARLFSEDV